MCLSGVDRCMVSESVRVDIMVSEFAWVDIIIVAECVGLEKCIMWRFLLLF